MKPYFSLPNNSKYLASSQTLINPSILSNPTRNSLLEMNVLYEMLQNKIISSDFSSI